MPIRHRGENVLKVSYRSKDAVNVSYATDDAHVFTNDGNSDALAPQTAGTFLFEDAMVTVTIDAAGNVSVSAVLVADNSVIITASTTADFTATSPVNSATNRSVQVDLVVPTVSPAYDNQGQTVTGVLSVAQTVDPLDTCSIGAWSSCSAGVCTPTCVETRTVTRVVNGLQDLTNPCNGVATTRTVTNPAYVPGTSVSQGPVTPGVETVTGTSACTVTDTSVGCCPDATCSGAGTAIETYDVSASTRVDTTTRNCDGGFVSSTVVTVTPASTGNTRTIACTGTYTNPDTCSPCSGLAAPTATPIAQCPTAAIPPQIGCGTNLTSPTGFLSVSGFVFMDSFDPCLNNTGNTFTYYTAADASTICDGSVPANGTAGSVTLTFSC